MQTSGGQRREKAKSRLKLCRTANAAVVPAQSAIAHKEPGPITTGSCGYEKSSNGTPETIDHAVWVPAQGRDDTGRARLLARFDGSAEYLLRNPDPVPVTARPALISRGQIPLW
jgi:hypothetical protein